MTEQCTRRQLFGITAATVLGVLPRARREGASVLTPNEEVQKTVFHYRGSPSFTYVYYDGEGRVVSRVDSLGVLTPKHVYGNEAECSATPRYTVAEAEAGGGVDTGPNRSIRVPATG